ncbi:S-layer homology domain-containing protein [Bifidobacterium myosotis]|nr:S-layer homology domain-containing protein [Bifidobacterium myosotis]
MTGNTKVWRAPLAGLASVAMIATMGVAASTANAAPTTGYQYPDVKITLDYNGGTYTGATTGHGNDFSDFTVSSDKTTVTLTDKHTLDNGYEYADGIFAKDLYGTFGQDGVMMFKTGTPGNPVRKFSGWYTEKQGGQAVDPTTALADGTTLYAHWSQGAVSTDESENFVHVDTKGEIAYKDGTEPDGAANVIENKGANSYDIRLADGDTLADWELPQTDAKVNNTVPSWDESAVSSAKAGDTLTVSTAAGALVTITRAGADGENYDIYKDGVLVNRIGDETFDVLAGSSLSEYQAVTSGTRHLLANGWKIYAGTSVNGADYQWGSAFPAGNAFKLVPQGGFESVVVRVHKWNKTGVDLRYFVPSGSNFAATFGEGFLAEVERPNAQFEGWYDRDQAVTWVGQTSADPQKNDDFFTPQLIITDTTKADPVEFSFSKTLNHTDANIASNNSGIDLYAGYNADAKFKTIQFDPNYSGADVLDVKIYEGKKLGPQLPAVTRDGYILDGWYSMPKGGARLNEDRLTTSNPDYPKVQTYYAHWTAESKGGVNGLQYNLARGYVTDVKDGQPLKNTGAPVKVYYDKTSKKWFKQGDASAPAGAKFDFKLALPAGYNEASWKQFNTTRDTVVKELIKELNLSKTANIQEVYNAVATKLSAEKADTYNREFAGKLVANTDYPDVNYDDANTHAEEVTYLTDKGIVKGYADGTFGYGAPVARVDFIVWLYRAAGSPAVDSQASFTDVTAATVPNQEFRDAIAWAAANKITTGYADGTFAPYATLNRQDAVAFLYRASGSPKFNESYADVKFADVTAGDTANHSEAVLWAAHYGIAKGYSGSVNRFGGLNIVVRQDAAAFLARTLQAGYTAK